MGRIGPKRETERPLDSDPSGRTLMHRAADSPLPLLLLFGVLSGAAAASAQDILRPGPDGRGLLIQHGDMAVLSSDEKRQDLNCSVEPLEPKLEYDLSFRAGFVARTPLSDLVGPGNALRILFRVQPLDKPDAEPTYFSQRFTVPSIEEGAEGEAPLPGEYRLGPGRYRVDWLMRDRGERVCSDTWEVEAKLDDEFASLASSPLASTVGEVSEDPFKEEPPVRRAAGRGLYVRLVTSFTPTAASSVSLGDYDQRAVVSMLRAITREPEIHQFDVVAYNAHEERVIFEQTRTSRIDFPALGEAVRSSQGGMVDIEQLEDEDSGEKFLHELVRARLRPGDERSPDAVIFVGPKVIFERNPDPLELPIAERVAAPLFYFIYNRNPRAYPWRDAVSSALKNIGCQEFDIVDPKDFGASIREMMKSLTARRAPSDSD